MGKTIDELLEERAKIDEEIRRLRERNFKIGNTKFVYQHFRYWDELQIKIKQMGRGSNNWYTIINFDTLDEVIKALDGLILDLEQLQTNLQEEQKRNV